MCTEAEFFNVYYVVEVSGHNLESSQAEVSVYTVYITNQFQITFAQLVVHSKEENYFKIFVAITSKDLAYVSR
jgi:hypothetical protein